MPLQSPILDNRTYQQLADELRQRIPVFTPEWTDHNPTDPGIALLELFAYLGEDLLFRFNQLPDTTRLAFLRLLQIPLRPPGVSSGLVRFSAKADTLVPAGTTVRAGKVPFRTTNEVLALPVDTVAAVRARDELPADEELRARTERAVQARGLAGDEEAAYYTLRTLAANADLSAADAVVLDPRDAVDGLLWVALLAPPTGPPPVVTGKPLTIGFLPDDDVATRTDVGPCPGETGARPSPPMVWRVSTATLAGHDLTYLPVPVVADTSEGLTRPGVVTLRLPDGIGVPVLDDPALAGTGGLPPELDDDLSPRLLAWLQVGRPASATEPLARVAWLAANGAAIDQQQDATAELLGTGTAEAGQRYTLAHRGVIADTLAVEVEEAGRWAAWEQIDDLAASPAGRHYVLDPEAGEVRFGDGLRGRAPQIGQRIRVLPYRYGGGEEGNVAAGAVTKCDVEGVTVVNPAPTRGGSAAETIPEGLERIPGELRRHDRAVTGGDFRELALETPGAGIGRAECLPRFHPAVPSVEAAGVVSVVVWPREDRRHPSAPMPDRVALGQVCRWLDARRLVTTELYVIPPTYRRIAAAVGVRTKPGFGVEAVRRWVELVLRQYLAPLPPYGPEGGGWPLGRRVHGPELEAAALQVDGVEFLEGLRLSEQQPDGSWLERTAPATVVLAPYEVPELAEVTVVEGTPIEPGRAVAPPEPARTPVPIPVERLEC